MCETETIYNPLLILSFFVVAGIIACSIVTLYFIIDFSIEIYPQFLSNRIIPLLVMEVLLCILMVLLCVMRMTFEKYYRNYKRLIKRRLSSCVGDDSVRLIIDGAD